MAAVNTNYVKVLVPILVILIAAYQFSKKHDEKADTAQTPLASRYSLDAKGVSGIDFVGPQGEARIARVDGGWQMSAPGNFPGDGEKVEPFVQGVLDITPYRALADQATDQVAQFGLDKPAADIQLSDGSKVLMDLAIGSMTADKSHYYAQEKQDRGTVLLLPTVPVEALLKNAPNDFRGRKIFHVDPSTLAKIDVAYPGGTGYTLEKEADGWQVTKPFTYRAKERMIDALIVHLQDLQAEEFLPTPREQAAADPVTGLATPQETLTLTNADGSKQTLNVGKYGLKLNQLYVTASTMPETLITQQYIADKLRWTDADVKEDRLVIFAEPSITAVEVRLPGADNLEVNLAADGSWNRIQPTNKSFSGAEIKPLLEAIITLAPQGFISQADADLMDDADLGFEEYTMQIVLKKSETLEQQILTLGKLHRQKGWFTQDSLTKGVYLLPEAQVRALQQQIETIRGGDAPKDVQQKWTADQDAQMQKNEEQAAEDAKKAKKEAQKERNGTGIRHKSH